MNKEDFERLRNLCDENGFGIFRNGGNVIVSNRKERVEVDFVWSEKKLLGEKMVVVGFHDKKKYESDDRIVESVFVGKKDKEICEIFTFLAEQLEKYLNNEL